jgi:predicted DNA-binding ribbon-helix-helix protein
VKRANVKRSYAIAGHRTSLALEPEFWRVLDDWARVEGMSVPQLIKAIDARRIPAQPLSSALRVAALKRAQKADA